MYISRWYHHIWSTQSRLTCQIAAFTTGNPWKSLSCAIMLDEQISDFSNIGVMTKRLWSVHKPSLNESSSTLLARFANAAYFSVLSILELSCTACSVGHLENKWQLQWANCGELSLTTIILDLFDVILHNKHSDTTIVEKLEILMTGQDFLGFCNEILRPIPVISMNVIQ